MQCCEHKPNAGWRGVSSCAGSGAMLLLLPKCPACIAAYLALFAGAGVAGVVAPYLRMMVALGFLVSGFVVLLHWFRGRVQSR